ncbi:MAG: hypothetical protein ACI9LE_000543 [Paraglaciecola sp.]|jgi:hypothetical protein
MLKKKLLVTAIAGLCSLSTESATDFSYDGHYVESEYDISFDIDYYYEVSADNPTGVVKGGTIALSTHNGQQYMYISHPLGFKDLSYAEKNKDNNYTVGWNNKDHGNKKLDGAIGSEFIGLSLTNNKGTYQVKFDPDYDSSGPGTGNNTTIISGGNDASFGFLSTSDYNQSLFIDGLPNWFTKHSPETLEPIDINGCADESSSDPSCYQLADTTANKVSGQLIDWDFNWGLEIKLNGANGGAFFDDISSINLSDFGYKSSDAVISLDELHASDPKTLATGHHDQGNCMNGQKAPNHEPCGVEVIDSPDDTTPVPEPSVLALVGLGIVGIWYRRRNTA